VSVAAAPPSAGRADRTTTGVAARRRAPLRGVVVVVPAHDEEDLLGACLRSIHVALAHPGVRDLPSCIVVALDSCRDASATIARQELRACDRTIEVDHRNVGAARAAGAELGIETIGVDPSALWLAHTDADSTVPPHWLARQRAMTAATDAIAGIVRVDDWSPHDRRTRRAFDRSYRSPLLRPHLHVHGANLGVRASAYLDVGGFPSQACSEDHALWHALQDAGHVHRASRRVWVRTSARRLARASGGFADTLVALAATRS